MYYSTGMHNSEKHIRITVTFPEYADTSKTIGIISSYSSAGTNRNPLVQDYNRNMTGYGNLNLTNGHTFKIDSNDVISETGLGSTVVSSSLTSVGTISSGTWNGSQIASAYLDTDTAHLSTTQTFSGAKTFSATVDIDNSVTYKHISLTADSDDLDVSGCTVVECTPSGTDRLGGLTGGVQGQILYVLKVDSGLGRLIIEHNEGTGNQDIFTSSGADVMLSARGGMTLYCNGTS